MEWLVIARQGLDIWSWLGASSWKKFVNTVVYAATDLKMTVKDIGSVLYALTDLKVTLTFRVSVVDAVVAMSIFKSKTCNHP